MGGRVQTLKLANKQRVPFDEACGPTPEDTNHRKKGLTLLATDGNDEDRQRLRDLGKGLRPRGEGENTAKQRHVS